MTTACRRRRRGRVLPLLVLLLYIQLLRPANSVHTDAGLGQLRAHGQLLVSSACEPPAGLGATAAATAVADSIVAAARGGFASGLHVTDLQLDAPCSAVAVLRSAALGDVAAAGGGHDDHPAGAVVSISSPGASLTNALSWSSSGKESFFEDASYLHPATELHVQFTVAATAPFFGLVELHYALLLHTDCGGGSSAAGDSADAVAALNAASSSTEEPAFVPQAWLAQAGDWSGHAVPENVLAGVQMEVPNARLRLMPGADHVQVSRVQCSATQYSAVHT